MKIDPKYFNSFLGVVAIIAALLIAYYTVSSQQDKRKAFKERIMQQDSLQTVSWPMVQRQDSLRIADFKGHHVLIHFWSNWSDASISAHQKLATLKGKQGKALSVIAAAVGLRKQEALSYINKHEFPFYHVAGSKQFSSFGIPGVPAYLLYTPAGRLRYVSLGILDDVKVDSISNIINGNP
ncbi:TlpA family protein disulfide reductase [Fodinibius sediminis]|uniref:Thiol-disulfide isomerase or thioredoxin n=1 Tax=Fodinibius sediminis TaxID=1214077 RepID=A0A521DD17_9BACT|nr:hypothetical protein [Fodinibius sediminis]SMO68820.1 hypothetical protein SAMN06265218_109103 [Fodinibius sediminis]